MEKPLLYKNTYKGVVFYRMIIRNNLPKIEIDHARFIKLLESHGFGNLKIGEKNILIRNEAGIVRETTVYGVKQFIRHYLLSLPKELEDGLTRRDLINRVLKDSTLINSSKLDYLEECNLTFQRDKQDEIYFYFRNGIVKVRGEGVELVPYNLNGNDAIWESQVINFDIKINTEVKFTDVEDFLWKVSADDEDRFEALLSVVGFLCSRYKLPTQAISTIFMDEKFNPDEFTNGRTGKSLIFFFLSLVRKVVFIDGKTFSFERYPYEQVNMDTDICLIDDVKPNFDFTSLYAVITGSLTLEKKYLRKVEIPFERSPKFAITTNHVVKGSGGESEKARKHIIELAPYYDANFTPEDDYGYCFYSGWNETQLNDFYNFMFYAARFYLNFGLKSYNLVNAERKELIARTSLEFLEFIEDYPIELNIDYDLQKMLVEFEEKYYPLGHGGSRRFNSWIRIYLEAYQIPTYGSISGNARKPLHMSNGKLKLRFCEG